VAKDVVEDNELLADYSVTSSSALNSIRTPKSSILSRDNILLEAQNLIALQNVDTPLKGGENTPLHSVAGFGSSVIKDASGGHTSSVSRVLMTATPNALISTPFRTHGHVEGGSDSTPGRALAIPSSLGGGSTPSSMVSTPGSTPLRDKLAINPETAMEYYDPQQNKEHLKKALTRLPDPKNEYEIVVNQEDIDITDEGDDHHQPVSLSIEDQADIDARREAAEAAQRELEMKKQSQSVQRNLPRPVVISDSILKPRGENDVQLSELQEAEEAIKQEMLVMLHHDALKNPTVEQLAKGSGGSDSSFLSRFPYDSDISLEEMKSADDLMRQEANLLKEKMGHGDLPLESYTTVWDECLSQVLYLKQHGKVVRASHATKKDKMDTLERKLDLNRSFMGKKAKKAAQIEKKLKIILGGYQTRSTALIKNLQETQDQIESTKIQLETFKRLQSMEEHAITRRVSSIHEDVSRQKAREKVLQTKYDSLNRRKQELEKLLVSQRMTQQVVREDDNPGET